ncbi:cyclic nucleotide-binding domain-containing protein [Thermodesulfobacteriota bacterium]
MDLFEVIDKMPIFKYFTDQEKQTVCEMDHTLVNFQKGDLIIEEGDTTKSLFVLMKGSALITKKADDATIRLSKLKPGELFGEMSFFSDAPRRTNVVANDQVIVMKIDETFVEKLDPVLQNKIKDYFIELLIVRLDHMNDSIMAISKSLRF